MNVTPLWAILVGSIFTNNILFASFLGMCSFLVCLNRISTAIGLGTAVTFVLFFTTILNYLIYHFILVPLGLEIIAFIIFIAVIAAFVQFVEMFVERYSPTLYYALGIFLPLITVNCTVLAVSLFMVLREYSYIATVVFAVGSAVGWMLAIMIVAAINEKLKLIGNIPKGLQGPGIIMVISGIIALAFFGFSGMVDIK